MCGIAGLIHRGKSSNVGSELQGMLQALKHRGEDSTGYALYGDTDGKNFIMRFKVGENVGEGSSSVMEDVSVYDERKKVVDETLAEMGAKIPEQRLWVFTSGENYQLALADGSVEMLEQAGAVLLQDTCPEVTPYNRTHYNHLLTNSLKAEHYLTSGLNRLPTSVMPIIDCVAHAFDPTLSEGPRPVLSAKAQPQHASAKSHQVSDALLTGAPLQSQDDFCITGPAMVTDVPITYLGYVNRDTGVIEETGHPLDGRAIENSILIYPKGSGSTVAPFVLMGLLYTGKGPKAIVNRDVCPLTLPACSLLGLPYGHGFDQDPCMAVNDGDLVELKSENGVVSLTVLERVK